MYSVAVIGCGVIGLTSALEIQKQLCDRVEVTIFTENKSPHTTGDVAAGLWMPYLLQNTPENLVEKWSKATYEHLLTLWKNGQASELGISLQLVTEVFDENYQPSPWIKTCMGYQKLSPARLKYYSNKTGVKLARGFSIVSFTWEASQFLPYLEQQFIQNGGRIIMRTIKDFEELADYDLIINCTGLNAKHLVPDDGVHPVRGQVIRVKAPWQLETFLLCSSNCSTYIIPNHNCVILGGTSQLHDYNLNVDENDRRKIIEGCYRVVPALASAEIIQDNVGLRPGRASIRLEAERREINAKELKIIHNYGHGGSGITLSIGCAQDCALMAKALLRSLSKL